MKHKLYVQPNDIKYSKDLEWLKPFVEHYKHSVPLHKIKSIKSYRVKKGLTERSYGSTIKEGGKYSINLRIYLWNRTSREYRYETIAIILDTLAHELAHVKQKGKAFGKHDHKHLNNQAWFLVGFSYILKVLGIKDTSMGFNNL